MYSSYRFRLSYLLRLGHLQQNLVFVVFFPLALLVGLWPTQSVHSEPKGVATSENGRQTGLPPASQPTALPVRVFHHCMLYDGTGAAVSSVEIASGAGARLAIVAGPVR